MIYLDHAATSWPKPPGVIDAMRDFLEHAGGNPGRSGHLLSIAAGRIVYETRESLAEFFGLSDPLRVILTPNVTYALNIVLNGYIRPGDHVVTTSIEHNAVMRPLRAREAEGVRLTIVACAPDGTLDPEDVARAIQPDTRLVVVNHGSNVMGSILPVAEIGAFAHQAGVPLLVDAAQTAGVLPIDMQAMHIDLLGFTGHKGLQGPPGTGGLLIGERIDTAEIPPLVRGGTGSSSELEYQPDMLPDCYESGTPNGVGFAGLGAGLAFVRERGLDAIRAHEVALTERLITGLDAIPGVTVYGPQDIRQRTATVSFTVADRHVSQVGWALDEDYGILCRVGLHCAPAAHRTIGTFPEGTVRMAAGVFTTLDEIDRAIAAVAEIARS